MSKKAKITFWLFILSIIYMLFFMHPTMWRDESFTMALLHHNYGEIIGLDAMDVHPPLYYLVLKTFLNITTFWTSSIFTKILFARFFSYGITILTFVVLARTARNLEMPGGNAIQWIGFFLAPSVMRYATQIRMYSLAALFLSLLFNQLQHYDHSQKVGHLFLAVFWAVAAAYTHYFAAVAAGWFLIIYFIKFQFAQNDSHAIVRAIWSFVIMFIPWGIIAAFQFHAVTATSYWIPPVTGQTILNNFVNLFTNIFGYDGSQMYALILIALCLILIIWGYWHMSKAFNVALTIVLAIFILTNLTGIMISVLIQPIYIARYAYPIYVILMFLVMVILSEWIKSVFNRPILRGIQLVLILLIGLILGLNTVFLADNQFVNYVLPIWSQMDQANLYQNGPDKVIKLSPHQNTNDLAQTFVELQYMGKQVTIKDFDIGHLVGNNNPQLFHGVFDNVNQDMYNSKEDS
jgi:hypothetical protein